MELPTETWRTSSGAGCNTPAPAARRKPSRWAGTTRAERGLRLAPQSRRGATPGSGRAAGQPEERHPANESRGRSNLDRAPLRRMHGRLSEGGGEEPPPAGPGPGNRPGGRRDRSGRVVPGRGATPEETDSSTRCAGQPAASSRRASRASARGGPPFRQLAAGSAPRASGNAEESAAGRGAFARPTAEGWSRGADRRGYRSSKRPSGNRPAATSIEVGSARKGPETSNKFTRGCRASLAVSARVARAILRSGQPPSASWKTAKAVGGAAKANEPRTDRKREENGCYPGRRFCRVP
jgi:hypothetical protein